MRYTFSLSASIAQQPVQLFVDVSFTFSKLSTTFAEKHHLELLVNEKDDHSEIRTQICVYTPSGFYSSTIDFHLELISDADVILGSDWVDGAHAHFYEGCLLDPDLSVSFGQCHVWRSLSTCTSRLMYSMLFIAGVDFGIPSAYITYC